MSDRYPERAIHAFDETGVELWRKPTGGNYGPLAPKVAADGTVLMGTGDGFVHALDPHTGNELWNVSAEHLSSDITVYQDGRASYCADNQIVCVDLNTHKVTSNTPLPSDQEFESDPVLGPDGTVYGGGKDGYVHALESGTGIEKWRAQTDGMLRNSPAVATDGTIYAGCIGGSLHAIHPDDGSEKWKFSTGSSILPSPVVGPDGTVFVANSDGMVYAVDPASGRAKWGTRVDDEIRVEPRPADKGLLYVVADNNTVSCLDQATGQSKMHYQAPSYIHNPPACDGQGNFYYGCNNGRLYAVHASALEAQA
ncbi:PQQ-binding-like beta-propeller repeat protein [bacterium]|nr:PQQ-binding-like beta-propeller repeat protein [bacterium]